MPAECISKDENLSVSREAEIGPILGSLEAENFEIKIVISNKEKIKLTVSPNEIVQEIHRAITEREDCCHRTCFYLTFNNEKLDLYTDIKSIQGLKRGSEVRLVEDQYCGLEARNHIRHVLDIMNSLKPFDGYTGKDNLSPTFFSTIVADKIKNESNEELSLKLPNYITVKQPPAEPPLIPLHPINESDAGINCLKQLVLSNYNPPTAARRMAGDLLYLVVTFPENKCCHITASTRGFFVNQSTDEIFDPRPLTNGIAMHSIVDLFKSLSNKFRTNFETILKKRSKLNPYERYPGPYRVNSWLAPSLPHTANSLRKEEAFTIRLAFEENLPGMTRDWNDELQATRALTENELLRDRAVFKSNSDFVTSSVRTAMNVVNGEVPAINPGENRRQQMFIWNNMFLSLGFDVKEHYKELGGDAAAYRATSCDLNGVKAYSNLPCNGLCTLGTALVDYLGYRVTAQTIIPGILEKDQEQLIVYGSNDFGKSVTDDDRYSKLLSDSADALKIRPHKIIGKNGKVIELKSSVDCKGIIGNDDRTYLLDFFNIFPPDVNYLGGAPKNARPVLSETMQELGYPYKHPHLLSCVRQELVEAFCEVKLEAFMIETSKEYHKLRHEQIGENGEDKAKPGARENGEKKDTSSSIPTPNFQEEEEYYELMKPAIKGAMAEGTEDPLMKQALEKTLEQFPIFDQNYKILFNPDAYKTAITFAEEEKPKLEKDKKLINDLCEFLVLEQIPSFIHDCSTFAVIPQDGKTIVEIMHQRGINARYLNRIVKELQDKPHLEYLLNMTKCEIVVRAAKHLFKTYMQDVDQVYLSAAVAHFLNCFFTAQTNLQPLNGLDVLVPRLPKAKSTKKRAKAAISPNVAPEMMWSTETVSTLWTKLNKEAKSYFHIDLGVTNMDEFLKSTSQLRLTMLRAFCRTVGIQLNLQDYFSKLRSPDIFNVEDIIAVNPIVKHLEPRSLEAQRVFALAQKKITEGKLEEGYSTMMEAVNLFTAVYGPLHEDIGACNRILARLSYVLGSKENALQYQTQATLICERVLGVDHPSTAAEYNHLAHYCFANNNYTAAMHALCRARYLAVLCHGPIHPEIAQIDINLGLLLQVTRQFAQSIEFLENAHKLYKILHGKTSLKVAFTAHLLSCACCYVDSMSAAVNYAKERVAIYAKHFEKGNQFLVDSEAIVSHMLRRVHTEKSLLESPPTAPHLLDVMNRINGIFYITFGQNKENSEEDGGKLNGTMEANSTVTIEECTTVAPVEEGPTSHSMIDGSNSSTISSSSGELPSSTGWGSCDTTYRDPEDPSQADLKQNILQKNADHHGKASNIKASPSALNVPRFSMIFLRSMECHKLRSIAS
nr:eukaryotic translation initiation [Hymenolepis microstoma]